MNWPHPKAEPGPLSAPLWYDRKIGDSLLRDIAGEVPGLVAKHEAGSFCFELNLPERAVAGIRGRVAGTQAAGQFAQQNYANQIARQNAQMGLYGSLAGMAGTALGGQFGGALGKSMFGG